MRKTKKKKKLNLSWIMPLFIIFIMTFSVFMYGMDSTEDTEDTYDGKEIIISQGRVYLKHNNQMLMFYNTPQVAESINISGELYLKDLKELDITFDPTDKDLSFIDLIRLELAPELLKLDVFLRSGLLEEHEDYSLGIITCQDATSLVPVVVFRPGNETKIEIQGNCIIAQAQDSYDYLLLRDRILYSIIDVI